MNDTFLGWKDTRPPRASMRRHHNRRVKKKAVRIGLRRLMQNDWVDEIVYTEFSVFCAVFHTKKNAMDCDSVVFYTRNREHLQACSCASCGHRRKWHGETMQERRNYES